MVNALFDQYHNDPMGGHFNGPRTYEKLRICIIGSKWDSNYLPDANLVTLANRLDHGSRTIVDV
jgi:hypothetical protein